MDILKNLNDKQILAVQNTEGYVRVIAGAGSGKTKLLVSRYAYLVKEYGIDAANILCVTFTNKAAGEMKKRISNLIGPEYSTSLICTYHGFGTRLIREDPEKLFLSKGFQIIDTYQQKTILEEIFQNYELKLDYANFQSILKKIAAKKQDLSYVAKMCIADKNQILPQITTQDDKIIEDYLQRQKAIYSIRLDLSLYTVHIAHEYCCRSA
ncbi:MAG: ATP-dependent helicase [Treponema sp.]|nr:ATP-dependent helicase [Treponema sp.]